MRLAPMSLFAVVFTGCTDAPSHWFVVDVGDREIERAELTIDGQTVVMDRVDNTLIRYFYVAGEGSGGISIELSDGTDVDCGIGYIMTDFPELLSYRLSADGCEYVETVTASDDRS